MKVGDFGGKVQYEGTFGGSGRVSFYRQDESSGRPKRSDPKLVRFCGGQLIAYLKFGSFCFDDEVGFIIFLVV